MARLRRAKGAQSDFFPGFADIAEIGMGSLATVFRAREIGTNRLVALKLLNVRDASPRALESFERETIALGAVSSHPNIVTLYRSFRAADGRPVLVLELCRGAISDGMRGGQGLAVPEVVALGIKIAGALETAHRAEILHRDVKPQNILVTEFGEPALADFGVAMLQSSTQTTAGLFDFTTLHAAPELLEGGETSAATDVYELASSLYQLVAGRSAFRAYDGESPASVILRILRDPVQPLVNAHVPTQLSDLLIYAMNKDKNSRPPTAAEFAAELAAVEAEQGWPRTQFLIRDPSGSPIGLPNVTRLPQPSSRPPQLPAFPPPMPGVGIPSPEPVAAVPPPPPVPGPPLVPAPMSPPGPAAAAPPVWPPAPVEPVALASPAPPVPPAAPPPPVAPPPPTPPAPGPAFPTPAVPVPPPVSAAPPPAPVASRPATWEPPPAPPIAPVQPAAPPMAPPAAQAPPPPLASFPPPQSAPVPPPAAPMAPTPPPVSPPPPEPAPPPGEVWPAVLEPPVAPARPPTPVVPPPVVSPPVVSPPVVSPPVVPPPVSPPVAPRPEPPAPAPARQAPQPAAAPAIVMREVEPTPLADVPPVEPEPSTTVATPAAAVEEWSATAVTSLRPPALPADRPRPQPAPSEVVESAWAPTPAPARRPMRIDGDGDDDPRPVQDAPIRPQPPQPRVEAEPSTGPGEYPIPPAYADAAPPRPSVPTWSYRGAPGPVPDVGIDPTTLRRRVKLRSGTSGIVVDETRLVVRRWWRRREIDWRDVEGFEPRFAGGDPSGGGRLVARTVHGPVELPVTGDTAGDLRYLHALLDAYRLRSRSLDDRS